MLGRVGGRLDHAFRCPQCQTNRKLAENHKLLFSFVYYRCLRSTEGDKQVYKIPEDSFAIERDFMNTIDIMRRYYMYVQGIYIYMLTVETPHPTDSRPDCSCKV